MVRGLCFPLLLCGCAPTLVMPPPEFDHPFAGEVVRHPLTVADMQAGIRSKAVRNWFLDGFTGRPRCDISLRPGDADAERVEVANCNGWAARDGDVNDRHRDGDVKRP